MIKYLPFFIIPAFILAACHNTNEKKKVKERKKIANFSDSTEMLVKYGRSEFLLEAFETPDTIDGCGSSFTYDSVSTDDRNSIFVSDIGTFGIIKVNRKLAYLNFDSTESREISNNEFIEVYKSNEYKVILKVKRIHRLDEVGYFKGTLEIISDRIRRKFKIHGQMGC